MTDYMDKVDRLKCLVLNMPHPNHDTLKFMCRHLKRWEGRREVVQRRSVCVCVCFQLSLFVFPPVCPGWITFYNAEYSVRMLQHEGVKRKIKPSHHLKKKKQMLPQEGVVSSSFLGMFCRGFFGRSSQCVPGSHCLTLGPREDEKAGRRWMV